MYGSHNPLEWRQSLWHNPVNKILILTSSSAMLGYLYGYYTGAPVFDKNA